MSNRSTRRSSRKSSARATSGKRRYPSPLVIVGNTACTLGEMKFAAAAFAG